MLRNQKLMITLLTISKIPKKKVMSVAGAMIGTHPTMDTSAIINNNPEAELGGEHLMGEASTRITTKGVVTIIEAEGEAMGMEDMDTGEAGVNIYFICRYFNHLSFFTIEFIVCCRKFMLSHNSHARSCPPQLWISQKLSEDLAV